MATWNASQHLASGALSGLASSLALQPLDLVKTQLQRGGQGKGLSGISGIFKSVVTQNGILGLWRGTTPTIARSVPGVAIYFYTLQSVRARLARIPALAAPSTSAAGGKGTTLPKLTPEANLLSGGCTRVAIGFLLNPLAVLKARFESGAFEYNSIAHGMRSLVQTSGMRGLWQGFLPSAFRDAPYAGLFVASYEGCKNYGEKLFNTSVASTAAIVHSGAGMFAGAFATVLTHPFDMVKELGPLGFFSGMSLRMTRKVFSSAIGWTVYEAMLLAFKKRNDIPRAEERHGLAATSNA
ncbi:Solute carrier family 25 [Ceratobasidium theobromae]|uniref:Solute carrier family 25 n=1 Tax=Ceratobasidium theobromae TaxID=1582974 RepID=A0A5N5QEL2_9AGAM|nr:Solute carrier family 25 [Ceratobasidium theobromae]